MNDNTRATHIQQVATVFVPVADQDRALAFYVDKLGFEKRAEFAYGDGSRWIEVAPPGSAIAVALVPFSEGQTAGGDQTHCAFTTDDIEADHATLRARGVQIDTRIARKGTPRTGLNSIAVTVPDPVPAQFFFRDIDGNRFLMVESLVAFTESGRSPGTLGFFTSITRPNAKTA
jgi:catechol 2,3-dioxygenase-like lactoylglutathione lyase family enzyme